MLEENVGLNLASRAWRQKVRRDELLGQFGFSGHEDPAEVLVRREELRAAITALDEAQRIVAQEFQHYRLAEELAGKPEKKHARQSRKRQNAAMHLRALRVQGIVVEIYDSQQGRCAYCGVALDGAYHVDHMVPISRGGGTVRENLCCACPPCNLRKNDLTAEEFRALSA